MNTRQTVEFAALVSAFSSHVIERPERLPKRALEQFWDNSQKRLKLWLSAITYYNRRSTEVSPEEHAKLWKELESTLSEIFVTEVLTRVWGAILTSIDEELCTHEYEPIARNVLIGHLDARKRALQLLATDSSITNEQLAGVDLVRRRVERWTDLLLGHLVERYHVDDFAFNPQRAREFGSQQLLQSADQPREQAWTLVLVGLRMAFPVKVHENPPNDLFLQQIIASILDCFPSEAFQTEGPFRSILDSDASHRGNRKEKVTRDDPLDSLNLPFSIPQHSSNNLINFSKLRNRMPPPKG